MTSTSTSTTGPSAARTDRRNSEPIAASCTSDPTRTGELALANDVASHVDLVVLARDLSHVAAEGETDRVHSILCRIRTDLAKHLVSEAPQLHSLEGAILAAVTRGQQRLLALVDEMLLALGNDCGCLRRSAELGHQIRRQAKLEAALLPAAATRPCGAARQPTGETPSDAPTPITGITEMVRSSVDARSVTELLVVAEQQQVAPAEGPTVALAALSSAPAEATRSGRALAALRMFGAREAAAEITGAVARPDRHTPALHSSHDDGEVRDRDATT